jgi:D-tyrosyl-tRNA(Tyr) deacylase
VLRAQVTVGADIAGRIDRGLLVYLGVAPADTPDEAQWLARKVAGLRIFDDERGKLNLCLADVKGQVLAISNFTLLADANEGRRPDFGGAASGEAAKALYDEFCMALQAAGATVARGIFGASMIIDSLADGPVNVVIDRISKGNAISDLPRVQ